MNDAIDAALAKYRIIPVCDDCWDDHYAETSDRGETNGGTTCMACQKSIPSDQKHWFVHRTRD